MSVDRAPMVVDGDGLIYLQSERHGKLVIRIPAGERQCEARGLSELSSIRAGDEIRALGAVTGSRDVTVCAEGHSLVKLSP